MARRSAKPARFNLAHGWRVGGDVKIFPRRAASFTQPFVSLAFSSLAPRLLKCLPVYWVMIDALFNQPNYLAAKKLLDATALRQEAIASNLANLETPHYQRMDVAPSFKTALRQALAAHSPGEIASVQPRLETDSAAVAQNRDGNTVDLENELMEQNKNVLAHALETQLITGSLLRLRLAITGRSV
jgi:flagellar basal-body rod protein FlgB